MTDAEFERLAIDAHDAGIAFAFWAARNVYGETPAEHAMSMARYYEARAKYDLLNSRLQEAAKQRVLEDSPAHPGGKGGIRTHVTA